MPYELSAKDIAEFQKGQLMPFKGNCSCKIYNDRPSFCKQGPLPETILPECGFYFKNGERRGECLRCGKCCSIPRKNSDPYQLYHPLGSACRHLKVEENK